jgi:hypothetical protein
MMVHDLLDLLPDIPSPYRSREARSDGKTTTTGNQEGRAGMLPMIIFFSKLFSISATNRQRGSSLAI